MTRRGWHQSCEQYVPMYRVVCDRKYLKVSILEQLCCCRLGWCFVGCFNCLLSILEWFRFGCCCYCCSGPFVSRGERLLHANRQFHSECWTIQLVFFYGTFVLTLATVVLEDVFLCRERYMSENINTTRSLPQKGISQSIISLVCVCVYATSFITHLSSQCSHTHVRARGQKLHRFYQ